MHYDTIMFECVPNISEGRREETIVLARAAISSVSGVRLLHEDVGFDANRTVFTFVGSEEGIKEACLRLYRVALEKIDLRQHSGAHPRLGAVDVCPIVPIASASFEDAEQLAIRIASSVASELKIPVFLYERSQRREFRKKLSHIRRGQFEGLRDKLRNEDWTPDFGPRDPHPSFGATVIGARDFLIAFNVSLDSKDPEIAKAIAKQLRDNRSSTEAKVSKLWSAVRAIGWEMPLYGCTQVSTNIVDINSASLVDVYQAVEKLARERGIKVIGSELIGLVPRKALLNSGAQLGAKPGEEVEAAISNLNLSFHSEFDETKRVLES